MMTRNRLAAVHMAKESLSLTEEQYKLMLSGLGVTSSKDLSDEQFTSLMNGFERLGYQNPLREKKARTRRITREVRFDGATQSQIGYIYHLWETAESVRDKSERALLAFILRMTPGVSDWKDLTRIDASSVITALNKMK